MHDDLISRYLAGPQQLRDAIAGMSPEQIDAAPVPGKWSTRDIICHIADFEPIYADRIKLIVATDRPPIAGGFHEQFRETLSYGSRNVDIELDLISATRKHLAGVLHHLDEPAWSRSGIHSEAGELSVLTLLERITGHIPHHIQFIVEKRAALGM